MGADKKWDANRTLIFERGWGEELGGQQDEDLGRVAGAYGGGWVAARGLAFKR